MTDPMQAFLGALVGAPLGSYLAYRAFTAYASRPDRHQTTRYFTHLRRRWCAWRGHPDSGTGPVVILGRTPDYIKDGVTYPGYETTLRSYRCSRHDPLH